MKILGCMAAAWLVATGPALAQEAGTARSDRLLVVTRDAGLEHRLVLARELIALSTGPNISKQIEQYALAQIEKAGDEETEEAAWVRANMPGMISRMVGKLIADMAPVYAEVFSEEELTAQIDFYRTPIGRSIAAKAVELGIAQEGLMQAAMTGFLTELQSKYCAEFDCDAPGGQAGAKPSSR